MVKPPTEPERIAIHNFTVLKIKNGACGKSAAAGVNLFEVPKLKISNGQKNYRNADISAAVVSRKRYLQSKRQQGRDN
jgi:hypothetical protein